MKIKMIIDDNIYDKNYKDIEMVFKNVVKLKDNEWSTHLDAETLAKMWIDKKVCYIPEMQRGTTLKRIGNELKEVAVDSKKKIAEITKSILNDDYHPDQIVLNLLVNGNEEFIFDNNELYVKGVVSVLDGQHRFKSLASIYINNQLVGKDEFYDLKKIIFPIKVTKNNIDEGQLQFYQYSLTMKINKSTAESFNKKNAVNRIVINLNSDGVLKNKIDTNNTTLNKKDTQHITTFSTMVSAIKDSYGQIDDEKVENELTVFLQSYFKELISIFPELINYEERQLSNKYNLICENFMMYGYIELSQFLFSIRYKSDWKKKLRKIKEIDFNKLNENGELNETWKSIMRVNASGIPSVVNNKTTRTILRNKIKEQFYLLQE